jgi:type IV pilus assembly protein PilN
LIEINLLPGAARKSGRRVRRLAPAFSLPSIGGLPPIDRGVAAVTACWVAGLILVGYMFLGLRGEAAELELALASARQDSTRYASVIATNRALEARRDSIVQKLEIIQDVDAGRFIWPHILDEVSRALPRFTWLVAVTQRTSSPRTPGFSIEGRTGNTFALTEFMKDLEASPFLRGVRLTSTELVRDGDKQVHSFILEASFEEPAPEFIETVSLFASVEE